MTNAAAGNRLANETSPYLLQHATNPVDWYPWGEAALQRARREDKPILLSVGYAACHWCHVMERESFEDEHIARLMNDHFVCVKVDREERPDIDEIYMAATVALTGSGGWPMTVFLTPDQRPFFAGTYFPPVGSLGRPGFADLLTELAKLWRTNRATLLDQAQQLTAHVTAQSTPAAPLAVSAQAIDEAVAALEQAFEPEFGGFSGAPKFPPSAAIALLLHHYHRTGHEASLAMATKTLDGMKNGGIYDHVGGGFARYSTDERWLVPHFEKMLYDNAQLGRVYTEAFQLTKDPEYERVARETFDYVLREMQDESGGFYSATDADSEGEEGKYFVWSQQEILTLLGAEDATRFCAYYDASIGGNWEGKNILNTPRSAKDVARQLDISLDDLEGTLTRGRAKLYSTRQQRIPPLLDDKVLVSWNGLMIGALAEGYRVFRDPRYLEGASRAAAFLLGTLSREDGGLFRTWRRGSRAHLDAYLEDYAFLSDALLDLYEAAGDPIHLNESLRLAERLIADFADPAQGDFYQTAANHETLIVRAREGHDGALPSANGVAARVLARLSYHLGRADFRDRAVRAIRAYGARIDRIPRAFVTSLSVADRLLESPVELVFAGNPTSDTLEALAREVARHYLPNRIVAHVTGAHVTGAHVTGAHVTPQASPDTPLTEGKTAAGTPRLYICRHFTCEAPLSDPAAVSAALRAHHGESQEARASQLRGSVVSGHASKEGTERYAERHHIPMRPFAEVLVSSLGFGGYRIVESSADHRSALAEALKSGVNLIDTSTNYSGGSSETLVGQVLAELIGARELARDEVVVVSKVGYVQAADLAHARQRADSGNPYPDVVELQDDLWHCVHPQWIERQITQSLERLGLETLDACLLHNPEYFLQAAAAKGEPLESTRDAFYQRIERAFAHLEAEVERGRIRSYGVSSNTLAAESSDPQATQLEQFLAAAERARALHFGVIQLPLNLLEAQGAQPGHVVERARDAHLAVLTNRPLNAIVDDGLLRLVDPPALPEETPSVAPQLDAVAAAEQEFRDTLAPHLRTAEGGRPAEQLLAWGTELDAAAERVTGLEQWSDIEHQLVRPHTRRVFDAIDSVVRGDLRARWVTWRESYATALDALLFTLRLRAAEHSAHRIAPIRRALLELHPDHAETPLSRLAVWAVASAPGVTTVLVGMRQTAYVRGLREVLRWSPMAEPARVFSAIQGAATHV